MWLHERHNKILEIARREGKVFTSRLVELFDVSRETVRRDLLEMEEKGDIVRVHGGAVYPEQQRFPPEPGFADRLGIHVERKEAIGARAAALIDPGSIIFVDAGSTTLLFAKAVLQRQDIKVVTNSYEIARLMARSGNGQAMLLGGTPHADVPANFGEMTLSGIDRFLADYAVISPVGFHQSRGATDYELHEAEVARAMIHRSQKCILLCHFEKIGVESRVAVCRPDEVDYLVTDGDEDRHFSLPRGQLIWAD